LLKEYKKIKIYILNKKNKMDKQVHTQKIKEILKKYNLSTKKELNKYISTILQTNEIGNIIGEFDISNDILKLHYNYE